MEFGTKHRNTLRCCVVLSVAVLLGIVVGVGVSSKLESRRADANRSMFIPSGDDPVANALVSEHLSRLENELGVANAQSPASKREELLAMSYKLQLQNLSQEERRKRALAIVRAEMNGQQDLYARLSLGSRTASTKSRFAFGVGGALLGVLAGFTTLFFIESRYAKPETQVTAQATATEDAPLAKDFVTAVVPELEAVNEPSRFAKEQKNETPKYVQELQVWSGMRELHFGSTGDLSGLTASLSNADVRDDLGSLIRYIMYSENLTISSFALLDLLSLAWTQRVFSEADITAHERKEIIEFVDAAMKLHD